MKLSITAAGAVLPPGSTTHAALESGTQTVSIDGLDESGMVRCVYPDGFVKHHQAETVENLATKVTGQLRGRYGLAEVVFTAVPKALEAGEAFTVEA